MKKIATMIMACALTIGCSSSSEHQFDEDEFVICSADNIGAPCERDDNIIGICVGPRECSIQCETVNDCPYVGECVDRVCLVSSGD